MLLDNALVWIRKRIKNNPILKIAKDEIVLVIHTSHLESFCLRLSMIVLEADLYH
jgi:hypothetical protein